MHKIISFLFSTRLMAMLFVVFALAMGIGTFIEDAYNTETARVFIYNAWWFEAIMLLFFVNFFGNIKRYKLHKKEKWATLLLHLSFIFIIIGAFVTRYISFEGRMPIREGATESRFYSDKKFITVFVDGEHQGQMRRKVFEKPLLFTSKEVPFLASNYFDISDKFSDIPFDVAFKDYKQGATEVIKENANGELYLKLVEQSMGTRHDHFLKGGSVQSINNILFALNQPTPGAVNISVKGDDYTISTPFEGTFMRMADQLQGTVAKDSVQPLMMRSLYRVGGAMFVIPDPAIKGKIEYEADSDFKTKKDAALTVTVTNEGQSKDVTVLGNMGKMGEPVSFKQGSLEYTLFYGSKVYELPFAIKLNDFIADKYPGTEKSYSSFKSKIMLIDEQNNVNRMDSIYMNHILDYRGYRFFQSSFDDDEQGTVLSVNHDQAGTWLSYIGYFLLYTELLAILFDKNSRFGDLVRKLNKVKAKKESLSVILLFLFIGMGMNMNAQTQTQHNHQKLSEKQLDSIIQKYKVSEEHAEKFGHIIIQDFGGRMKPANTFSSELLRKVSKSDTYNGLNADQVFLSMALMDQLWYDVPILDMERGNDSIRVIAGLSKEAKYAAMSDFFDSKGNYKLNPYLNDAYKAGTPNKFQKDFIDIDKRLNLLNWALSGQILRVLPVPGDENNKWVSYPEAVTDNIKGLDTIRNVIPAYFQSLAEATQSNNYTLPNSFLEGLSAYQKKYGGDIMPSEDKVNAEILYNKYDIFKRLYSYYALAGILMIVFVIITIFNNRSWIKKVVNILYFCVWFLFVLHTLGLIARWYISGHAPWSNAYESVIYVAWATTLFGLILGRKSMLTVASTAFVASIVLMVAQGNWTDPEIANLVPVLNSYWLMIHVAVIVASYGPFTLGMILGLVALLLMIFTNKDNRLKMELNIKELTYINEMALTVGLVMLTIGNFLGGQWANESWGRYWGWDPKETWALTSIMVYAFVIHMRLVPSLRGTWIYNLVSVFAYFSVLMTYFGVNFYLTGLHSYASGEVRTPMQFFYMAFGVIVLGIAANFKYRKYLKK
ncbi:cytochrome c biogenesis protein CcsA [Flavobacterium rhizosphaerae]|uniref:Cytochrome c biogenesis protein CcsA n=1 Tax=Flavobacterium rhizosphaerae TaxID=3163298 RepID=A0ABW8YSZ4_9FLAO